MGVREFCGSCAGPMIHVGHAAAAHRSDGEWRLAPGSDRTVCRESQFADDNAGHCRSHEVGRVEREGEELLLAGGRRKGRAALALGGEGAEHCVLASSTENVR